MRRLFLIISLTLSVKFAHSQDIITLKNGDKLKVKVLQVNDNKIIYKKFDETDEKLYSIDRSKVFIIIFEYKNAKYQRNPKIGS